MSTSTIKRNYLKPQLTKELTHTIFNDHMMIFDGANPIIDWEGDFSIFVSLALIKINRDSNILSEYLEIYLSSEIISQEIKNRAKQGALTNLHLEEIREFLTIIPNIEEQKQIIKICRSLNQNIGLQKDKVLKLTQLKKSLTQDLLTGKVRVSVN